MGNYTVKKVGPIGDHDVKYGQRYWGTVEEADMEISFNLMNPRDIEPGMKLDFDEKVIRETKGSPDKPPREYMQLRKVRVSGVAPGQQTVTPAPDITQKLDAIIGNQKLIMSWLRQLVGDEKEEDAPDKVVEVDDEEEINLDDIPF